MPLARCLRCPERVLLAPAACGHGLRDDVSLGRGKVLQRARQIHSLRALLLVLLPLRPGPRRCHRLRQHPRDKRAATELVDLSYRSRPAMRASFFVYASYLASCACNTSARNGANECAFSVTNATFMLFVTSLFKMLQHLFKDGRAGSTHQFVHHHFGGGDHRSGRLHPTQADVPV